MAEVQEKHCCGGFRRSATQSGMKKERYLEQFTVMQRVDDYLYLRFLMLVLLISRTLRRWVMLEKKPFESPLEERKERRREEGLRSIYTHKTFPNVASPKSVCQIMATGGCHRSLVAILDLPEFGNHFLEKQHWGKLYLRIHRP